MDLSSAVYVQAQMPGPIPIVQTVRSGAQFVFRGGLDKLLITSPQLQAIGEQRQKDWIYLIMDFATTPGEVFEKLSGLAMLGPAFVICRMEEKKENEMLIGPGKVWEQGYWIAGVVTIEEKRVILAVRRGKREKK